MRLTSSLPPPRSDLGGRELERGEKERSLIDGSLLSKAFYRTTVLMSEPQESLDIAIVGGGLAGLTCAVLLAESGAKSPFWKQPIASEDEFVPTWLTGSRWITDFKFC